MRETKCFCDVCRCEVRATKENVTFELKERKTQTTKTVERFVCDECVGLAVGEIANRLMKEHKQQWFLIRIIFEQWIPEKIEKGEKKIDAPSANGRMKGYMENLGLGE